MDVGVFLPISGRAATPEVLTEAAQTAERLGFTAVWSADRVVTPWHIETPYPYSADNVFIVPPDRPFFDSMACLSFLAGRTEKVRLGISVLVLPYRHPLYWARLATTIDHLSRGRLIMGVGIGWMKEEFEALGISYSARGRLTDEQLEAVRLLLGEEHCTFEGEHYRFSDVSFHPKALQPHLPIWVGGEGKAARRRAGRHGDAWFPYFVEIAPQELRLAHEDVRAAARDAARDPDAVALTCCSAVEVTDVDVTQDPRRLRGSPRQLLEALQQYERVGVEHVALQFTVPRWPDRLVQMERFAEEVLPALQQA
ncbi:MAG TPA: TIGR03619 family F420-dependent LLM class oxidoreductase [Candidatus Dormibacteraeota bacterium]|nr:TIGR03619 family F420-dependent LLM class oxidoreductase [Candidatus Dormibacteraeota bacterium]